MEYQDINEIIQTHFSSFDRTSDETRKISIIQSTRMSLSMLRVKMLKDIDNSNRKLKEKEGKEKEIESVKNIFQVLDSSLCYLVTKDDFYSRHITPMASDFEEFDYEGGKDEKDESDDTSSSYSLNSLSLHTPKRKEKEREGEEENDFDIQLSDEKEISPNFILGIRDSYDKTPFLKFTSCSNVVRNYLSLLEELREKGIITRAPMKLFQLMRYHLSSSFKRKDVMTCENYKVAIDNDGLEDIIHFFQASEKC